MGRQDWGGDLMRMRTMLGTLMAGALLLMGAAGPAAQGCQPDGEVQFLCGPVSPEDFAPVPQSPWVIVSSMIDGGDLYLADTRDNTATTLFSPATGQAQHDTATYGECPGPVTSDFRPHGLYLRASDGVDHTLLVVGHGAREAIEVFDVDMRSGSPALTWIGCAVAPDDIGLNSVVALPEGGFASTSPAAGNIWEWRPGAGWSLVPGSTDIGPNGLEISRDGQWFYVGGYGAMSLIRLSRGRTPIVKEGVEVGFHIDNVRWGANEMLLAAGHRGSSREAIIECLREDNCDGVASHVAEVDPEEMTARRVVDYPHNDLLLLGTVAIQVGDEIWVGQVAEGDRIARFPAPGN